MPPKHSDYQPLAQGVDEEADVGDSLGQSTHGSLPLPVTVSRRPSSRPRHIDLRKLDTAFKRWTESIAQKVKGKKKAGDDNSKKEILRSVFEPHTANIAIPSGQVKTLDHNPPMTKQDFDALVQSVRRAISEGTHPKMISKGSSGSYFARAKNDGRVQTVAVFKPKDEEPYGRLNPKTTKWLHRQLRWLIPFGRSCLIPNLSYISEAAASLLDSRLELNIVPRTELVSFSSAAFFYDWIDRNAAKKGKHLPEKIGSMQYFLHGYQDASDFLRKHPWPGRSISDTFDDATHRTGNLSKRFLSTLKIICGRTGDEDDLYDEDDRYEDERVLYDATEENEEGRPFYWSQALQSNFREELEKLVILDYLMLNTDRGADNYMLKFCEGVHEKSLVDVAPTRSHMPVMSELKKTDLLTGSGSSVNLPSSSTPPPSTAPSYTRTPHIHIAAIDNSLSFPHEHPRGWRSYAYGWLYLPVSIIGRPFSERTRAHFLPLLTSKAWWEETTFELRKLFALDPDFHPKMFRRQLAVIKGQAWNIVQSLKHSDEGPLELTRRVKVLVWDDEVEVVDEGASSETPLGGPLSASPRPSVATLPLPLYRRTRSQSEGNRADLFPPPMRRLSTDATGVQRPVSFAAKFQRVHPGLTGVTVLEHMERLDAVEAGLKRLGVGDDSIIDEEGEGPEEVDVGESSRPISSDHAATVADKSELSTPEHLSRSMELPESQFSPSTRSEALPAVMEVPSVTGSDEEQEEQDMVAMSKSMSQLEPSASRPRHTRYSSQTQQQRQERSSLDWIPGDELKKRIVIVERLETVNTKPFLSCW